MRTLAHGCLSRQVIILMMSETLPNFALIQGLTRLQEAVFAQKYAELYQQHVHREAWSNDNASTLPDSIKDVMRMELLKTPPNLDAHVRCHSLSSSILA